MAFQGGNYPILTPAQSGGFGGVLQQALETYATMRKQSQDREKMAEAIKRAQLENQYYGKDKESEMALRGSQTGYYNEQAHGQHIRNQSLPEKLQAELAKIHQEHEKGKFALENPLIGHTGAAGQIGDLLYLMKNNPDLAKKIMGGQGSQQTGQPDNQEAMQAGMQGNSFVPAIGQQGENGEQGSTQGTGQGQGGFNPIEALEQSIRKSIQPKEQSQTQHAKAMKEAEDAKAKFGPDSEQYKSAFAYANKTAYGQNSWQAMPANAKMYSLAQAAGMGLTPEEASNAFNKGEDIKSLAVKHGFDPDNLPEPDYLPTTGNTTKLNERRAALGELKVISDFVTTNMKPYSKTIMDRSPAQIYDAIKGKNTEQQAKFFAARALSQEANLVRLQVANARGTIPAIKGITEKAMNNIEVFRSLVTPEVWEKSQHYIDSVLDKALSASAKAYSLKSKQQKIAEKTESKKDYRKMSDEELLNMMG